MVIMILQTVVIITAADDDETKNNVPLTVIDIDTTTTGTTEIETMTTIIQGIIIIIIIIEERRRRRKRTGMTARGDDAETRGAIVPSETATNVIEEQNSSNINTNATTQKHRPVNVVPRREESQIIELESRTDMD